jgi:hypothetical protein
MLSYSQPDEPLSWSPQETRIFPSPWRVEEFPEGYRILDRNDCVLAYVIDSEQIPGAESKGLTQQEACRIARVIASLPEIIKETPPGHMQWYWWKWVQAVLRKLINGLPRGGAKRSTSASLASDVTPLTPPRRITDSGVPTKNRATRPAVSGINVAT